MGIRGALIVVGLHLEGFGHDLPVIQLLNCRRTVVQDKGPRAGLVDGKRAVCSRHLGARGLRLAGCGIGRPHQRLAAVTVARIHIIGSQCAADRRGSRNRVVVHIHTGFGHSAFIRADRCRDDRVVIRTLDIDRQSRAGFVTRPTTIVGNRVVEDFGSRVTSVQCLGCGTIIVQRIAIRPVSLHEQRPVSACDFGFSGLAIKDQRRLCVGAMRSRGNRKASRLIRVVIRPVTAVQRAAGCGCARRAVFHTARFDDRGGLCQRRSDRRRIVAAGHIDGYILFGIAAQTIGYTHSEHIGHRSPGHQRLRVLVAIVQRIGPFACIVQRQAAVGAGCFRSQTIRHRMGDTCAVDRRDRPDRGINAPGIGIRRAEAARRRCITRHGGPCLSHIGIGPGSRRDHRRVVFADDVDRQGRACLVPQTAAVIGNRVVEGFGHTLPVIQGLGVDIGIVQDIAIAAVSRQEQRPVSACYLSFSALRIEHQSRLRIAPVRPGHHCQVRRLSGVGVGPVVALGQRAADLRRARNGFVSGIDTGLRSGCVSCACRADFGYIVGAGHRDGHHLIACIIPGLGIVRGPQRIVQNQRFTGPQEIER